MSDGYRINTIIMLFNVSDTVGRNFPGLVKLSKKSFYLLSFSRILFLFTFAMIVALQNSYLIGVKLLLIIILISSQLHLE
jgi:hypothetical protein